MISLPEISGYACIVTLAIPAAACVKREERGAAVICAALLFASWLIYLASWTPWAIEALLSRYIVHVGAIDIWSIMNALVGIGVLLLACENRLGVGQATWWGPVLFGLLCFACFNDLLYWAYLIDWQSFRSTANIIFLAEEAIFFLAGGANIYDWAVRHIGSRKRIFAGLSKVHLVDRDAPR